MTDEEARTVLALKYGEQSLYIALRRSYTRYVTIYPTRYNYDSFVTWQASIVLNDVQHQVQINPAIMTNGDIPREVIEFLDVH